MYQPSQSSYERISPVDEYRDVTSASGDNLPTYSTLQADASHLIAAPSTVDSSTLQHPVSTNYKNVIIV
jgi:hypothetical protein